MDWNRNARTHSLFKLLEFYSLIKRVQVSLTNWLYNLDDLSAPFIRVTQMIRLIKGAGLRKFRRLQYFLCTYYN